MEVGKVMETLVNILKRFLNPGDLERLGKRLGINIDFAPFYKSIVAALVPVGGSYIYDYISKNVNEFREKPTAEIVKELNKSGKTFKWVEDFTVSLFGQKITLFKAEPETSNTNAVIYGLLIIGGLFMLARR